MRRLLLGGIVLALVVVGCSQGGPKSASGDLSVIAAFYPLAEAAKQIGGDRVEVKNLTPPGAEPHDIELTTDQLDDIIDADVVLYLGRGFQPALEEAVDQAKGVALDLLEGEDLREAAAQEHAVDPHIWLDPPRWAAAVERIAVALAEADDDNADGYRDGAREYADRIEELDEEFEEGLGFCDRHLLVTSHGAFAYLATRYGLQQESIAGISPEAEPDPEHLSELSDLVKEHGVTTIFAEVLVSEEVARTLARETGAQVATLNPIEGLTPDQIGNGEDYASVMRENLEALRAGLGCK